MTTNDNLTLTDEDLTRLLGAAGASYDVPAGVPEQLRTELGAAPVVVPLHRRRGPQLTAAAAGVLAVALLLGPGVGGGGGGSSQNTVAGGSAETRSTPQLLAPEAGPPVGSSASSKSPAAVKGAPQTTTSQVGGRGQTADGARIVKTGTLTLAVADGKVSRTLTAVQAAVAASRGYVSASSSEESGSSPSGTITFRVPVASFEQVVERVRKVPGVTVVGAETGGRDVTATYADTQAQIASLTAARSRFLAILARARTIGETLSVQQRVDDVQGQIDRLEGQRRVLADQSDLATLTVTVSEKADVLSQSRPDSGLHKAWSDSVDGFTSGVEWLIAHSGRALLVLMVGGVLLLVGRRGWRLARRSVV